MTNRIAANLMTLSDLQ